MARRATGTITKHVGRDGRTYRGLRFTAYGKRRFQSLGAVTRPEAERELRHVLADVERGTWQPQEAVPPPPEPEPVPTFHEYSEQWWLLHRDRFALKTQVDYRWRLEQHLLPDFASKPLDAITVDAVERYIAAKLGEDEPLSPRSINMTLVLLSAILETAVERDLIPRNPAKGKRRRVRERAPRRSQLDSADAIAALLDAAGRREHRALLATLVFGGLRIGELCALRWSDVDLAAGWLTVGDAKTDAGIRRVKLRGALRDELSAIRPPDADGYVFSTRNPSNVRNRILGPAQRLASERLAACDRAPLPHLTPHSCRRTFASVLYALGESPAVVMAEMGHTSPALALRIYAQAMRRDEHENERLRALVEGRDLAVIGNRAETADVADVAEMADR